MKQVHIKLKHYDKWERLREANKIFTTLNIGFNIYNGGIHYVIDHKDEEIHYWPTTGRWFSKTTNQKGRFLKSLLNYLGFNVIEYES